MGKDRLEKTNEKEILLKKIPQESDRLTEGKVEFMVPEKVEMQCIEVFLDQRLEEFLPFTH